MATTLGDVFFALPARLKLDGTAKQTIEIARTRAMVGAILFALAFLTMAARVVELTLLSEPREVPAAAGPRAPALVLGRADIVDRQGELLATSLGTASLYANPRLLLNAAEDARRIAQLLPGIEERDLVQRFTSDRSFVWIRRNLTPRQQQEVIRLGIPGIFFQREDRRVYPYGALTSHLIGFTDIDNRGIAGMEQSHDDALRRGDEPVALSIDVRAQHLVREELARQIAEYRAIGGTAAVMDVATGEIMAMVSLPDFDANTPALGAPEQRFNRNTLGIYELGSVFKIFTVAMALEYGVANLGSIYDARGPLTYGRFSINDFHGQNRRLNVAEIFMYSSNIGAARMALQVGPTRQREFLGRLGLLHAPPLQIPEVGTPMVPSTWREINTITISYGHGISVSPIQLLAAVSATVNGGIYRPATLLRRHDGEAAPGTRVMSERTSAQMRQLMRLVVERGTGRSADAPGFLVGGKTGTADKPVNGRYAQNRRISSFAGAFPINAPRYALYVMIDEPRPIGTGPRATATGGVAAAPMVGRLVPQLAALWGIAPSEDANRPRELMVSVPVR